MDECHQHYQMLQARSDEDIEILKFLEIGYQVDMVKPKGKPFSIYTKEDLKRANNL